MIIKNIPAKPRRKKPNKVILMKIFEWEPSGIWKLFFMMFGFDWIY